MNPYVAQEKFTVTAEALTWMAVHGNLCLALRHPDNNAPLVRPRMIAMVRQLAKLLVDSGMLTQAEMDDATRYEQSLGNDVT